ncbi:MAG TPA: LacI family DNA-binding transcriptional regulator [Pseudonocardia sp.]|uniref:LacI family DNA-binding transcriptional regulator n=1 Tax=Pseudonocardia sp. TaxID=60912 RepID=UPI002B4AF248|nr:LacI family DNA-binding transcriptional regulator [Pseudonocardia sp.]HLU55623.1 LacI family DNA-binding transcriptional regulator [Pseudonocardia sp.]
MTLQDVAKAAKVSRSTASEALAGTGRMTAATRQSVVEAAQRLGYRPNAVARSLRTGRMRAIGLHYLSSGDRFASPYFREFTTGVLDVTQPEDYDLTLLSSNPEVPRQALPRVDGVIIADPIADDLRAHALIGSALPIVAGELYPPGMPSSPVVSADHATALRAILDHAHGHGATRPALIAPGPNSGWGVLLRRTFEEWCAERGLPGTTRESRFGDTDPVAHTRLAAALFAAEPDTDLLVVSSEVAAIAALGVVRDRGRHPGVDVLLACCADGPRLDVTEPSITAIDMRPRTLGRECARMLIDLLEGRGAPQEDKLVPAEVVFRASTGAR